MNYAKVLFFYIKWHYTHAILDGFRLWKKFVWLVFNFFSVPILIRTFFDKFERLGEDYKEGLAIKDNLATFVVNSLMRIVGMAFRSVVIIVGTFFTVIAFLLGIIILVMWLLYPLLLVSAIFIGLSKII